MMCLFALCVLCAWDITQNSDQIELFHSQTLKVTPFDIHPTMHFTACGSSLAALLLFLLEAPS